MIDVETEVYSNVVAALRAKFPAIHVNNEYPKTPSAFPAVYFIQADNPVYERASDLSNPENATIPFFTAEIFSSKISDKQGTKKSEAKQIAAVIADTMNGLGFVRTYDRPTPNQDDATIYRIVQRYRRIVTKSGL